MGTSIPLYWLTCSWKLKVHCGREPAKLFHKLIFWTFQPTVLKENKCVIGFLNHFAHGRLSCAGMPSQTGLYTGISSNVSPIPQIGPCFLLCPTKWISANTVHRSFRSTTGDLCGLCRAKSWPSPVHLIFVSAWFTITFSAPWAAEILYFPVSNIRFIRWTFEWHTA